MEREASLLSFLENGASWASLEPLPGPGVGRHQDPQQLEDGVAHFPRSYQAPPASALTPCSSANSTNLPSDNWGNVLCLPTGCPDDKQAFSASNLVTQRGHMNLALGFGNITAEALPWD